MKKRFIRILAVICAAVLIAGAVPAMADEEIPATPTDIVPAETETEPEAAPEEQPEAQPETQPETKPEEQPGEQPEEKPEEIPAEVQEEPAGGEEVLITKAIRIGETWEGRVSRTKPAVLKLDINRTQSVHIVVGGRNVWITVEKADRASENPPRTETDPDTARTIISWTAEAGSYLLTVGPVEPNLMAGASVAVMDDAAFEAWEAEQAENEPEPEEENELEEENEPEEENGQEEETEPENGPEEEQPEENRPESEMEAERHITVDITWDVPDPVIGDTAHFQAKLEGYDGLQYSIQWQYSPDRKTWYDIPGETSQAMDVVVTEENNVVYWRILVYVEEEQES